MDSLATPWICAIHTASSVPFAPYADTEGLATIRRQMLVLDVVGDIVMENIVRANVRKRDNLDETPFTLGSERLLFIKALIGAPISGRYNC